MRARISDAAIAIEAESIRKPNRRREWIEGDLIPLECDKSFTLKPASTDNYSIQIIEKQVF